MNDRDRDVEWGSKRRGVPGRDNLATIFTRDNYIDNSHDSLQDQFIFKLMLQDIICTIFLA